MDPARGRDTGIGRDVRIEDVTDERAIVSLIGPAARAALETEPPADEHAFIDGEPFDLPGAASKSAKVAARGRS